MFLEMQLPKAEAIKYLFNFSLCLHQSAVAMGSHNTVASHSFHSLSFSGVLVVWGCSRPECRPAGVWLLAVD